MTSQGYSLAVVRGLFAVVASRCRAQVGGLQPLQLSGPRDRLQSRGILAELLCGMWGLPGPGIEPLSPALAGGFFIMEPPGKPYNEACLFILKLTL